MIKVIAFDLVGVLVTESDIELTPEEEKLERMFGDNYSDSDYLKESRKILGMDTNIITITENIMNKLYQVKNQNLFQKIKEKYPNIKIIIATNHVSYIHNYINKHFNVNVLDDVLVSAEMNKIKPHADFYNHRLNKYHIKPGELLFLDDNIKNIDGAKELNIKTIKVDKDTDIFTEIQKMLK